MKKVLAPCLAVLIPFSSGCSTISVLRRTGKKDLSVLQFGMPRSQVIAKLGNPTYVLEEKGQKVDLYDFYRGLSGGMKLVRVIFHLFADFITAGLWEIAASPAEMALANRKMKLRVVYDSSGKVESFTHWGEVKISSGPTRVEYVNPS